MAAYSIWDWKRGAWRVYSSQQDAGMFDPPARRVGGSPKQGIPIEDAFIELPRDARFVRWSDRAEGRVATDAASRSQNAARLPEGLGGGALVTGGGGAAALGEWSPRVRTAAVLGLAFFAGVAFAAGLVKAGGAYAASADVKPARRNRGRRRRNYVKLKPGQKWRRGSGEAWKACIECAAPMGPFASVEAAEAHSAACQRCDTMDTAVTGVFQAPAVRKTGSVRVR